MSLLDLKMFFLAPFYRWRTYRDTLRKLRMRSKEEVFTKKREFHEKFLAADRQERKEDRQKYKQYLELLKWVLNDKTDFM